MRSPGTPRRHCRRWERRSRRGIRRSSRRTIRICERSRGMPASRRWCRKPGPLADEQAGRSQGAVTRLEDPYEFLRRSRRPASVATPVPIRSSVVGFGHRIQGRAVDGGDLRGQMPGRRRPRNPCMGLMPKAMSSPVTVPHVWNFVVPRRRHRDIAALRRRKTPGRRGQVCSKPN